MVLPPDNSVRKQRATALIHAGFILTGVFTVILGPILPFLELRWSLNDSQAAYFFLAQFAGLLAGVLFSSFLIPRRGFGSSFIFGFLLMGAGAVTLGRGSWMAALAAAFVLGVGIGFLVAATNLWIAEVNAGEEAGSLSLVNFSWTTGAVACPFLVELFHAPQSLLNFLLGLGLISGLVGMAFAGIRIDNLHPSHGAASRPSLGKTIPVDRVALILAAAFFLYVGTETCFSGWIATYSRRLINAADPAWIIAPSFFWAGMMTGRASATFILRRFAERRVVQCGAALGIAAVVFLLRATTLHSAFAGAFLAGLGCAAIFPILVAWMVTYYGVEARRVTGVMLAIAEFGAATLPWIVGYISARFGGLHDALAILIGTLGAVFLLATIYPKMESPQSTSP
jgi:fucose permease